MKRKFAASLTVLTTALLLSAFVCSGSQYHKANRTAKQIADDLHQFAVTVTQQCNAVAGHCTGEISDDEARALASWVSQATVVDDQFSTQLKAAGQLTGSNSQQIIQAFNNLTAGIGQLNTAGVLHLRSPKAQATFNQLYSGIQGALLLLQGIIANPQQSQDKPDPRAPLRAAVDPTLAIAAALALLKLIAQFKLDGSLTDDQLQAALAAENEDTRTIAGDLITSLTPAKDGQ